MAKSGSASDLIAVNWSVREEPLPPQMVCMHGSGIVKLAESVLSRAEDVTQTFRWIATDEFLAVLGNSEMLPWSDGAVYLGTEGGGVMFMPTFLRPSIPSRLLERAILKAMPQLKAPFAVLPADSTVVPLAQARLMKHEEFKSWLQRHKAHGTADNT